jgi:glycosyltransferase involved in cell wall biosynthesis
MKASVVIVTHNQSAVLRYALAALGRQTGVELSDFEVIVTDDSSTEDELEQMQRLVAEAGMPAQLVTHHSDRMWVGRARNNGINIAQGEILILLDGDMVPEHDFVAVHMSQHYATPNMMVAGNRVRRPPLGDAAIDIQEFWSHCRSHELDPDSQLARWQAREQVIRQNYANSEHSWRMMFTANMSLPAADFVRFDEHFRGWGPEDWELAYRMTFAHGLSSRFVPEAMAYEIDGLGGGVANVFRVRTQEAITDYLRNVLYFYERCPGLELEDVFWSLRKLTLVDGQWVVGPSDPTVELQQQVELVRDWLDRQAV